MAIEKRMINRLMAIDCPNCGLEMLSTSPYPAKLGQVVRVACGGCGGSGETTFRPNWQYTDLNAYPLEQALNRRYPRPTLQKQGDSRGQLQWDD